MAKIIRITTVPLALRYLLQGQMKFMREHGFDVLMVSADGKGLEEVIAAEGCPHVIVPMTRTISPVADLKCLLQLIRLFKKEKPDIVHTHTPKAGLLGMLAARLCGVKIRIHTIAGLRFVTSVGTTRRILIYMEKLTSKMANHVWPNSRSLFNIVKDNKLSAPGKLKLIAAGSTNGINLQRFSLTALSPAILNETKTFMRYDASLQYILFIGRIVKDKGVEELLDVFADLHQLKSSLRLVLLGSLEQTLDPVNEKTVDILQTHPGIIHISWNDAVEYFIALADLLIHPSHREGFPNVLLQAAALKCPVVCSRIPGNVDVIEDERTGLLFDAGHREDLKEKLSSALIHPDDMNKCALNAYEHVTRNFDQKVIHQKILEAYQELLKK